MSVPEAGVVVVVVGRNRITRGSTPQHKRSRGPSRGERALVLELPLSENHPLACPPCKPRVPRLEIPPRARPAAGVCWNFAMKLSRTLPHNGQKKTNLRVVEKDGRNPLLATFAGILRLKFHTWGTGPPNTHRSSFRREAVQSSGGRHNRCIWRRRL